ncbi:MAG TPA: 4'-phosphopantetheinyl transferase superfamily protein, partial [Bacteroidia bacterium]|nr:4'-phosphopantetheinyl transferase superfamily protein [Bacteroidia bacterium]
IKTKSGRILYWNITESLDELEHSCAEQGISVDNTAHHEMRRKQLLVTQLLHALMHPDLPLTYSATGKPMLDERTHVSISHSGKYLVMMSADEPCGVDIEKITPQVERIRAKFLSDAELERTTEASELELIQYWTAKEAMFKVYGSDHVFLRSNIFVGPPTTDRTSAVLQDGDLEIKRDIRFYRIDNMMLAWTESYDET